MNVRATLVKMILNAIELVSFILPPLATDCLDSAGCIVEAYSILHLLKCNVFILYIYKIYSIKINFKKKNRFFDARIHGKLRLKSLAFTFVQAYCSLSLAGS